jgi:hypothetical protein
MPKLRFLATALAAFLCALALSVGAALAQAPHGPAGAQQAAKAFICPLHGRGD